jgi:hypothetical protein
MSDKGRDLLIVQAIWKSKCLNMLIPDVSVRLACSMKVRKGKEREWKGEWVMSQH